MQDANSRRYAIIFAVCAALICVIPALIGCASGDGYLGHQYNTDDHMVYAAWMRQAMDGRFLFDNRFTIDAQPGLTIHVYFWLLGQLARFVGITIAAAIGRVALSGMFVWLLYGLVCRLTPKVFERKLALALSVFGGGLGFLVWHSFGLDIVRPVPAPLSSLMLGKLPIDVWQPEAFVFPSMLTNGLFMAALCLIVVGFRAILDARESWRPVPVGFVAFALLANIHSYDVAMIGLVLVAFLVMGIAAKQVKPMWMVRSLVIAAGAIGPALWLAHVLAADRVFQARAATQTYSPSFAPVFFGLVALIVLSLFGLWSRATDNERDVKRHRIGMGLVVLLLGAMFAGSIGYSGGYMMSPPIWALAYVAVIAVLCLIASDDPAKNLLWTWALVGLVAIYFPALFQRKLAMGLVVPWACLGAVGLASVIDRFDRGSRNVVTVLGILVVSGSSLLWFTRERYYESANVSNTTVHSVYLTADATRVIAYLNAHRGGRTVVLAMPGIPMRGDAPDTFLTPFVPDLNPILSGLTGVYTYAGHWSETPDYNKRRAEQSAFFVVSDKPFDAMAFLEKTHADYIVAPVPEAFHQIAANLRDMRLFGDVVLDGSQFRLIKVKR